MIFRMGTFRSCDWRRQYDSAAHWADSAITVEPNYLLGRSTVGYIAIERGDYRRARAAFEAARRLTTDIEAINSAAGTALADARAGALPEARDMLQQAESKAIGYAATSLHTSVYMAQAHAAVGATDRAIAWLRRYTPSNDLHFQLHLRCDPPFDPIAADPRFRALLLAPRPAGSQGC
jgi:tetratricopeptide (TPR) repeat protein